jgi:aminoglycoside phosphotransferase (APT) family kinase protein
MHPGQLVPSRRTVLQLVSQLVPGITERDVVDISGSATTSSVYRIGEDLVARFARFPPESAEKQDAHDALVAEHAAMLAFARAAAMPSPLPVAIGAPGDEYPLPWSLRTWIAGEVMTPRSVASSEPIAADIIGLIARLRRIDTAGKVFDGRGRGGDLRQHEGWVAECLERSTALLPVKMLRRLWDGFRDLPREAPDVMSHRDLIPANLLMVGGRLAGVLDTGDFRPADPALDLVSAWHLFDAERRSLFRSTLGSGDLEWRRGAAWAFEQSIGLVWYYRNSNPAMAQLGRSTLARLLADPVVR